MLPVPTVILRRRRIMSMPISAVLRVSAEAAFLVRMHPSGWRAPSYARATPTPLYRRGEQHRRPHFGLRSSGPNLYRVCNPDLPLDSALRYVTTTDPLIPVVNRAHFEVHILPRYGLPSESVFKKYERRPEIEVSS